MINIELIFPFDSIDDSKEIINFLNLEFIGVNASIDEIEIFDKRSIENVSLFSRLDLVESNSSIGKIKSDIQKNRYNHHIICVEPTSPKLASFAVSDGRVDMIRIGVSSSIKIFNTRYANRLEQEDKLLEIDLSGMFENKNSNYRQLIRIIDVLKISKVKFILNRKPLNKDQLMSYRGFQSIGRVLGLSNNQTNGDTLIERIRVNKEKIEGRLIYSGAELEW